MPVVLVGAEEPREEHGLFRRSDIGRLDAVFWQRIGAIRAVIGHLGAARSRCRLRDYGHTVRVSACRGRFRWLELETR